MTGISIGSAEEKVLAAALPLGHELADAAGEVLRRYFRQPLAVEDKADHSPVTIADREVEGVMRALIGAGFADHGVLGEEYGSDRPDAEWVWVLDPIDGTKAFISGLPLFGTLIALAWRGRPLLGLLDQPISRERWAGVSGRVSTLNEVPISVRECPSLARATLFATAPDMFRGEDQAAWQRASGDAKLVRYGADCYAYGLLASGFCDGVVEASLKPYDYCAHVPIIEGAGGIVTDWRGAPAGLAGDGRIAAAGDAAVHDEILARLAA